MCADVQIPPCSHPIFYTLAKLLQRQYMQVIDATMVMLSWCMSLEKQVD